MSIIGIVLAILIAGFVVWLIGQMPIDPTFQRIAYGVILFCLILWLLQGFGLVGTHIQVK